MATKSIRICDECERPMPRVRKGVLFGSIWLLSVEAALGVGEFCTTACVRKFTNQYDKGNRELVSSTAIE